MGHFRAILLCALALTGPTMPAQENAAAEDRIPVLDKLSPAKFLYLKDGEIRSDLETRNYMSTSLTLMYTVNYRGRDYRKMSRAEVARFDAMPKVEVRRYGLYFDGRKIKTNSWRVYKVHAAYHWNGGVLVVAETSKGRYSFPEPCATEIGFLDLGTHLCKFARFYRMVYLTPAIPDFLVPITIDASNGDLKLDVGMPDRVYRHEAFDLTVSVTNNSGGPVQVPLPLTDGLGVDLIKEDSARPPTGIKRPYGEDILPRGCAPDPAPVTLAPGESVTATVPTGVGAFVTTFRPGRMHIVFYWDALLDPSDREKMTRLTCERWLDLIESPPVDTTSRNLALEVSAPASVSFSENYTYFEYWRSKFGSDHGKVHAGGTFEVKVAVTNVSGRTILVPDDLGDGLGVVRLRPVYRLRDGTVIRSYSHRDERGLRTISVETLYEPSLERRPAVRFPYAASCSTLAPGATRETTVRFDPLRTFIWMYVGRRYPMTFVWDCLLDPDDREHVSRFSTGKTVWVEVTK